MRLIECQQNTPEWHAARCGRLTASRVADIMRQTKSGVSAMRATYMAELVAEQLTGVQEDGFCSADMQHGKDTEDEAALMYALETGSTVARVGFVLHPSLDGSGCSPDRLVNTDGLLQIKCPQTKNHIAALLGRDIAPDYIKQMQWEMRCTERQWCDFVSYDPRLPVEMQLHTVRVKRDGGMIEKMEAAVIEFLSELDETVAKLRGLYALGAAA